MTQNSHDKEVLVITGATASGKTSLAHVIATQCGGEIIMADSMKVYRQADVLTAKPPGNYLNEVNYHLIDIIDPDERYDAGKFFRSSLSIIDSIIQKGKLPIVSGGTSLYITGLMDGIADIPPVDNKLKKELEKKPAEEIYRRLKEADPERALSLHPNMKKRAVRALGVYMQTGKKMSWFLSQTKAPPHNFIPITISWPRERLYRRINKRVDSMVESGIVEETKELMNTYGPKAPVFEGLGYKEVLSYIKGRISFEEAVEEIKKLSRNYARRQLAWWRKRKTIELEGAELKKSGILS